MVFSICYALSLVFACNEKKRALYNKGALLLGRENDLSLGGLLNNTRHGQRGKGEECDQAAQRVGGGEKLQTLFGIEIVQR